MGRLRKDFALQEEGLAFPTIAGTRSKEPTALTALRISNILVPSIHIILGIMKNFARVWIRQGLCLLVDILLRNSQESVLQNSKRVFAFDLC